MFFSPFLSWMFWTQIIIPVIEQSFITEKFFFTKTTPSHFLFPLQILHLLLSWLTQNSADRILLCFARSLNFIILTFIFSPVMKPEVKSCRTPLLMSTIGQSCFGTKLFVDYDFFSFFFSFNCGCILKMCIDNLASFSNIIPQLSH